MKRRLAPILVPLALAAIGLVVGLVRGVAIGERRARAVVTTQRHDAIVLHDVVTRAGVRVDLYLPPPSEKPAPWMVFAHERGWPAPDEKERTGIAIADALQRRGIAVAVVSFDVSDERPLDRGGEDVAEVIRELARRATEYGIVAEPVLGGEQAGATLVTKLALEPRFGLEPAKLRGVIAINGVYDAPAARADAPPFLVLSAHADSPASAQSSRLLVRALERAGAKDVHGHFVSLRDASTLTNLSGEKNDVADGISAFVRREPRPGNGETAWALADAWGAHAPLTTETFWKDEHLVIRRPTDARFRAAVRTVFGEMARDLEPWPAATYDAIDLGEYLRAHPELGAGRWVEVTNARGEKLVLTRSEIDLKNPTIVVGIDDERNLFRMFVTYNVHRTYSWKPETEPSRPLMIRHIGGFLHVPGETSPTGGVQVPTLAEFALTASSFKVVDEDPLAVARKTPKPLADALTNEQGCLQCHALHGNGARAHHLRADDGLVAEAHGLALEEYPRDVLRRFLFEQDAVAKSFGVGPLHVSETVANQLLAEVAR
ncbi:MAG: hypothetical protein JWO86_5803 [Myxococcaceae bacterium]|nr:hypothetical protein [Myxococcaceae bacterium]MEA2753295.1 hypothetical protein [Myxococcales bacterium]